MRQNPAFNPVIDFQIASPETMVRAVRETGILPFFKDRIPGFSVQEMTRPGCWFDGDEDPLGPWDWKIECVHEGDIAYGKFLCGGKASFATLEWYKELMNYRRARLEPDANGRKILDYLAENGSIGIKEVRALLGVKKSAADAAMARLQYQCRVVTGEITRLYRGPMLKYEGWQVSSYCTPEEMFKAEVPFVAFPGFPFNDEEDPLATDHTPEESLEVLADHLASILPAGTPREEIIRTLK